VLNGVPGTVPLTAGASPGAAAGSATVTGTTSPGTSVVVAATLSPSGATQPGGTAHSQPVPTQTQQLTTADGSFTVPLTLAAGTWVITVTASHGSREAAESQSTVQVS
jgi:nitrogen fixation protein FixH